MAKSPTTNHGNFPTIAFVNLATVPLGIDLRRLVSALDKQLQRDFVPIWGYPATLFVTDKPKPGDWQIVFLDDSDAADAMGYHNLTKDGQPVSKVFVKTTIAAKQKVSVTASHELLEMLIDPGAQMWAQNSNGWFYAYEVCDAVEDEEYPIDGVAVSDFVYPSFFESWHQPMSTRFDHLQKVSRPFQTLQNGYQVVSNGAVAREVFASRRKEINFREVEVRTLHRSEYRKDMMPGGAPGTSSSAAGSNAGTAHAALLEHAGRFLTTLAAMRNPLPTQPGGDPFDLMAQRKRGGVRDPLPGGYPFEL